MLEIEKLDDAFSPAYEAARQYIDAQKERSRDSSEILAVDMLNRTNIFFRSETYRKDGPQEVGIVVGTVTPTLRRRH